MCGILLHNGSIDIDEFKEKLSLMNHRGPDFQDLLEINGTILGHNRLSIIDTSNNANQPMTSSDGNYVIIFNGEIYNYQELQKDLNNRGYVFKSNSDTEILLNGYVEFGAKVLDRINGMYSFAIYEKHKRRTFIARDPLGIKPLYYFKNEKGFTLASEIRTLKSFCGEISEEAQILFLLLGYIPESHCIFEGIVNFPAGHYAILEDNQIKFESFSSIIYEPKIKKEYIEIIEDIRDLLDKSIERHLISDAPIGCFLSGGLDSSLITAIAATKTKNLKTISLDFDEKRYSEGFYQNIVAEKYQTDHNRYIITENIFKDNIEEFIERMDQPTIDGINTFFVSKAANHFGLKTVLSGLGGDEIFYGYSTFKNSKKLDRLSKIPSLVLDTIGRIPKYEKHSQLLQLDNILKIYLPTRSVFSLSEISKILNVSPDKIYSVIDQLYEYNKLRSTNRYDIISELEMKMYMKDQLLRDSDVFGMASSIEIRVPLLDKDLVNYVLRIDPNLKFHPSINKILLAEAAKTYLPKSIIDRKKMGFTLPFTKWISDDFLGINQNLKSSTMPWFKKWSLFILQKFN